MTGILPETVSFSHNGQPILAVLVENAPGAGEWTIIETCSVCDQPLGHHSFYTTDPLLFYIHAHCIYDCAAAAAAPPIHSTNSGSQSRGVSESRDLPFNTPNYPSYMTNNPPYNYPSSSANYYPPFNTPHYPSYMTNNPSYNYPASSSANYYPPSSPYYYNQYHPAPYNYSYYNYHPSYISNIPSSYTQYDHYSQLPQPPPPSHSNPSSSSSSYSSAGLTKLTTTVVGSFMQALFSLLLSGS